MGERVAPHGPAAMMRPLPKKENNESFAVQKKNESEKQADGAR